MNIHYPHGLILRYLLDKAGISNKNFAKKINKSEPSLSNYMNQYTIAFNTLCELAQALDVDVSTFDRNLNDFGIINEISGSNHTESDWTLIEEQLKSSNQRIKDLEVQIELQKKQIALLEEKLASLGFK